MYLDTSVCICMPCIYVIQIHIYEYMCDLNGALVAQMVKNLPAMQETRVHSLDQKDHLEKGMATHSIIFAGKSHGQRSLVGYSPRGCKESDKTE